MSLSLTFLKTSEPRSSSEVFFSKGLQWRLMAFAIFVLTVGCSKDVPIATSAPHYAGTFEASCSPVDAPSIEFDLFRLGDPEPPQVSIAVWQFDNPITSRRINLNERSGYGAAFVGGTEWIPASDGTIQLEEYREGESARGWFWLELDGVDRVEGQFEVIWSDAGLAICG